MHPLIDLPPLQLLEEVLAILEQAVVLLPENPVVRREVGELLDLAEGKEELSQADESVGIAGDFPYDTIELLPLQVTPLPAFSRKPCLL